MKKKQRRKKEKRKRKRETKNERVGQVMSLKFRRSGIK